MIKFPLGKIENCTSSTRPELAHICIDAVNELAAAADGFVAAMVNIRVTHPADLVPEYVSVEALRIAREAIRYEQSDNCDQCGNAVFTTDPVMRAGKPAFDIHHDELRSGNLLFITPEPDKHLDLIEQVAELKELSGVDFDDPPLLTIDLGQLNKAASALLDPDEKSRNVQLRWRGGRNPILLRALKPQSDADYALVMPLGVPSVDKPVSDLLRRLWAAAQDDDLDTIKELLGVGTDVKKATQGESADISTPE